MGDLSELIAALTLERQLALHRVFGHQAELVAALLDSIARDVQAKLADSGELSEARRDRLNRIIGEVREIIDGGYVAYGERFADDLKDLAQQEARWAATSLNGAVGVDLVKTVAPTPVLLVLVDTGLFQGSLLDDWLSRQSGDTGFQFTQQIRLGVAQGETNAQIVRRLIGSKRLGQAGVIETSRRNAEALALTAIQTVTQRASMLTYEANDDLLTGWTQLSTLDGRTTDICIAYSGKVWDKEFKPVGHKLPYNNGCPRHFKCRSRILPKLKTFRELGLDVDEFTPSARASMDGQVSANMTFAQFLDKKGIAFQDEMLGKGRAQLWRDGKITLAQLLDQRGNPLTLEQLRERYDPERTFRQPTGEFTIYDPGVRRVRPDVSTPARRSAVEVEERIRRDSLETGAIIGTDGRLLVQRTGEPDRVAYPLADLTLGRGNVFTHNHPGGLPFSVDDVRAAADFEFGELRAVSPNYRHIMQAVEGWPASTRIKQLYDAEVEKAMTTVDRMVKAGELNIRYATIEMHHIAWVEAAKRLGLTYIREPS